MTTVCSERLVISHSLLGDRESRWVWMKVWLVCIFLLLVGKYYGNIRLSSIGLFMGSGIFVWEGEYTVGLKNFFLI